MSTSTEEDLAVLASGHARQRQTPLDAYEQAKHVSDLFNVYGKLRMLTISAPQQGKNPGTAGSVSDDDGIPGLAPSPRQCEEVRPVFHEMMKKKDLRERFKGDSHFSSPSTNG